jgi:hypothetical protein
MLWRSWYPMARTLMGPALMAEVLGVSARGGAWTTILSGTCSSRQ